MFRNVTQKLKFVYSLIVSVPPVRKYSGNHLKFFSLIEIRDSKKLIAINFLFFERTNQLIEFQEKSINYCTLEQLIGFFLSLRQNIINCSYVPKLLICF